MEEFKVGDWLRNTEENRVFKATKIDIDVIKFLSKLNKPHYAELWQPKEGEWCWYNKKYFIKVKNIKDEQIYFSSLDGMYINDWDYLCKFEPFIGELPTFLKDSK